MLLAIDVGNTQATLGCFRGSELVKTWRVSTHPVSTGDEFRVKLATLARESGIDPAEIDAVAVSSVVPTFTATLRSAFPADKIRIIDHRGPFSFRIAASVPPTQVGADRLVNAEAAVRDYGAPAIIVDSGTATTLCAVSPAREYMGGAIMPGLELSVDALAKKAAKLFTVELIAPERAIGTNTQDAIRSGVLYGYAEMIDGMVRRFKQELGPAKVIATGGVSTLLKGLTREIDVFDPDLTLRGIAYVYDAARAL
jgi:type III pantothenate kinase